MLFSYESQLILCAPLALLALWRARREKIETGGWSWAVFLLAAALFVAAIFVAACALRMPENPVELTGFKAHMWGTFSHMSWTLIWTIAWADLTLAACCWEKFWRAVCSRAGFVLLFIAVLVWGLWPLLGLGRLDTGKQWDDRVLDLLVPMALLPLALMARFRPQWLEFRRERIVPLVAVMLLAQSLWQISATVTWHRDVVCLRKILASKSGIVRLRSTPLAVDGMEGYEPWQDANGGRFDWVWPCLSISLAPGDKVNCLVCSAAYLDPSHRRRLWQPFDPLKPETLPDLRHYGLDFSGYISALDKTGAGQTGGAP